MPMTVVSASMPRPIVRFGTMKYASARERRRDQQTRDHPQHRAGGTGSLPDRVKAHGEERHDCEESEEQRGRQQMAGRRGTLCRRRPEAERGGKIGRIDEQRSFDQCQEHDRDLQVQVEETKRHRSETFPMAWSASPRPRAPAQPNGATPECVWLRDSLADFSRVSAGTCDWKLSPRPKSSGARLEAHVIAVAYVKRGGGIGGITARCVRQTAPEWWRPHGDSNPGRNRERVVS